MAAFVIQGKENHPPGQKPRRLKMVLGEHDDDATVRLATPVKKPCATLPPVVPSGSAPTLSSALSAASSNDSDDDAIVVIRPRSPRSPAQTVAPAIAEEVRKVLAEAPVELAAPASTVYITITDTPNYEDITIAPMEPIVTSGEPIEVEKSKDTEMLETAPLVTEKCAPVMIQTDDALAASSLESVQLPAEIELPPAEAQRIAEPENAQGAQPPVAVETSPIDVALAKEIVNEPGEVNVSAEPTVVSTEAVASVEDGKEVTVEEAKSVEVIAEESKATETEARQDEQKQTKEVDEAAATQVTAALPTVEATVQEAEEKKSAEDVCLEAEIAAQARRSQLEAKLAELQALNIPHSGAAHSTRTAVEERMAAVEEAWRKTVEAKSSNLANILAQCHVSNPASAPTQRTARIAATASAASPEESKGAPPALAAAALSSPTKAVAAPSSPSIEERKQRIERLRMERLEMKMRLENSRANNAPRRELASKKKSLRWADANGDKLSVANNYLVSVERPAVSDVPPPLPETPAPTEIPARFLDI